MNVAFEVLYTRGETAFLVKQNEIYYFVNLDTNKYMENEEIEVFLKQGYFVKTENNSISQQTLIIIEDILLDEENKLNF